jgi:poly-beta-hydroxyalkanoate depolymerase
LRCSNFFFDYVYVNDFFIEFYCKTINPVLPSLKFQNGAQI